MAEKPSKKPVDRAYLYGLDDIKAVIVELGMFTETFREFANFIEKKPEKSLAAHNHKSLERGLSGMRSSVESIRKAIWHVRRGEPIQPGETKPRSPAAGTVETIKRKTPPKKKPGNGK